MHITYYEALYKNIVGWSIQVCSDLDYNGYPVHMCKPGVIGSVRPSVYLLASIWHTLDNNENIIDWLYESF